MNVKNTFDNKIMGQLWYLRFNLKIVNIFYFYLSAWLFEEKSKGLINQFEHKSNKD